MNIVVCLKDRIYRTMIRNAYTKIREKFVLNASIVLNTNSPNDVLKYVSYNVSTTLYFLDADLSENSISTFEIARIIREKDCQCQIVFLSNYLEMCILSFKYKIYAMDCLIKTCDELELKIKECFLSFIEGQKKYRSEDLFSFNYEDNIVNILRDDVIFVESIQNTHKVILHFKKSEKVFDKCELHNSLEVLENKLGSNFIRCHRSFLVNKMHVKSINKKNRTLRMTDGSDCYYSKNNSKNILQYYV